MKYIVPSRSNPIAVLATTGACLTPWRCSSLLRLLYETKRMPRGNKSSNRAGNRGSSDGQGSPSERETDEARRVTRGSAIATGHEMDRAQPAPGAPLAQRQRRVDQRTSEPLSQLDSIGGSPSTIRSTPVVTRRKAGGTPASSAYSSGSRHSATTDDDDIGELSSQEPSAKKARRVSAQGKRPAAPLEALPDPVLLIGDALTKAARQLQQSPEPLDLRVYISQGRTNAKPAYKSNQSDYLGYEAVQNDEAEDDDDDDNGGDKSRGKGDIVLVDPSGARVATYEDSTGRRKILQTDCTYDDLCSAVRSILPDGFEFTDRPDGGRFHIPMNQFKPEAGHPMHLYYNRSKFWPIEASANLVRLFAQYGTRYDTDTKARRSLELSATGDGQSRLSLNASRLTHYRVLEILVFAKSNEPKTKKKQKKQQDQPTDLVIEIAPPVVKVTNDSVPGKFYEVGESKVLRATKDDGDDVDDLCLDLGPVGEYSQLCMSLERVLLNVQLHCQQFIAEYRDKIASNSGLYVVTDCRRKECRPVLSKHKFYEIVKKLSYKANNGRYVKRIRVGLSLAAPGEEVWKIPDDFDMAGWESDASTTSTTFVGAGSPQMKAIAFTGRQKRSARWDNSHFDKIVTTLYTKESSPLYHGLTREMCQVMRENVPDDNFRSEYALQEDGTYPGDYPLAALQKFFRDSPLIRESVCGLVPERGAFEPDRLGDPPLSITCARASSAGGQDEKPPSLAGVLEKIFLKKAAPEQQSSVDTSRGSTCLGISFVRLADDGKELARKDYRFEALGVSADDTGVLVDLGLDNPQVNPQGHPFGARLHMHAFGDKNCHVFNESDDEQAAIAAKTAHLTFRMEPVDNCGNGKFEYLAHEFHKASLKEILSYYDCKKEVVTISVFVKPVPVVLSDIDRERSTTVEDLMAKYG